MSVRYHTGQLGARRLRIGSRLAAPSDAQILVTALNAYSPDLLLLADMGTLQGDGSAAVPGDPLTAATATWQDQSGHARHGTQATVMSRPQLVASGWNGRAVLDFDALDDYLTTTANVLVGSTGYSILVAEVPRVGSSLRTIAKIGGGGDGIISGRRLYNSWYLGGNVRYGNGTPLATADVMHILSLSCPPAGIAEAHYDGADVRDSNTPVADWGVLMVGGGEPANSLIGAVVVVPYAARAAATTLLANYYGVSI